MPNGNVNEQRSNRAKMHPLSTSLFTFKDPKLLPAMRIIPQKPRYLLLWVLAPQAPTLAAWSRAPVWDTIPRRQNAVVNREMVFRIRLFLFRGLCTGRSGDFTHESSPEACGRVCARDRPVDDVFVCLYMTHYNRMLLLWLPSQTSPSSLVLGMRGAATGATTCSVTAPWRGSATCSRAAPPSNPTRTPSPRGG